MYPSIGGVVFIIGVADYKNSVADSENDAAD